LVRIDRNTHKELCNTKDRYLKRIFEKSNVTVVNKQESKKKRYMIEDYVYKILLKTRDADTKRRNRQKNK